MTNFSRCCANSDATRSSTRTWIGLLRCFASTPTPLSFATSPLPYHYVIAYPPEEGYEETIMPSANYFEIKKADQLVPRPSFDRPFQLRARPDGTLVIVGRESQFSVNVNSLDDPITFFRTL